MVAVNLGFRNNKLTLIGTCKHKGRNVILHRDINGKYFIKVDGIQTQRDLTANELARWFLNAMNEND